MAYVKAFIKRFSALLIPAGILLLAVLLLIPTILIGKSLRKEMEKSTRQASSVRKWADTTPSNRQIAVEKVYQNEQARDADTIERYVKQSTARKLVSYKVFPKPTDESVQVYTDFGKKYRKKIDAIISRMNARNAPTDKEIDQELASRGNARSETDNRQDRTQREDIYLAIKDAFLEKRASEISVYASANLFGLYNFWEKYDYYSRKGSTAIEDCWYSQIALWAYEDVADTIISMNSGLDTSSVLTSPVKRLVGVSFQKDADYSAERSGLKPRGVTSSVSGDFPSYVIGSQVQKDQTPSPPSPSVLNVVPWTTRTCDEDIDVIHFSLSVVVESNSIFSFMKELCREKEHQFYGYKEKGQAETYKHNQISIMRFVQEPVDREDTPHVKYRYGDAAVVKLNLTCEYIFHRIGYDEIKPEKIKELLDPPKELSGGNRK